MKFSDNKLRNSTSKVYIKTNEVDFSKRDEYNSLLWEKIKESLYQVPARAVKIGESIYNKDGIYLAYRIC